MRQRRDMTSRRWPWTIDPNDREANYRRPIRRSELVRLFVKGATLVGAFFWFRNAVAPRRDDPFVPGDGWVPADGARMLPLVEHHEGAAAAIAVGACMLVFGVVGLVAAGRGELEEIFLTKRSHQVAAQALLAAGGLAIGAAGLVRFY